MKKSKIENNLQYLIFAALTALGGQTKYITAFKMVIFFQVGIAGNVLVLVVIVTKAHMQTTTNMYILNMAAADILMCLGKKHTWIHLKTLTGDFKHILHTHNIKHGFLLYPGRLLLYPLDPVYTV